MAVNFRPNAHFEQFINELIESGRYSNKTEVMHAALRSLEDEEKLREARLDKVRHELSLGEADIEADRIITYENAQELADDIKQKGREKLAKVRRQSV